MENNPLISVIIPIYKVQAYLPACLDSVVGQTYTNLEIICIDDGSPDDSGKIAEEYAAHDKRIKVIHQKNGGQGSARNTGLKIAQGDYIGFVDSDDFIAPDYYERLMNACQDDDMVMTTGIVKYPSENDKQKPVPNGRILDKTNEKQSLILGSGICWNKIYRKSFLLDNDIQFYPQKNLIEDNYFTVKAYLLAKSIKSIDTAIYHYRMHNTSTIHSKLTDRDFICLDIAKGMESYKSLAPAFAGVIDKKISREIGTFYRRLSFPYKREFKEKFHQMFPHIKIAVRKPLKWIYAAYDEGNTVYHSFLGDRIVIEQKR